MNNKNTNIYEDVYHLVLNSGNVHKWKDFSVNVLHLLSSGCQFDQARIYFFNGNGKICDQYLIGVDKRWANAYHEYYSKIEGGRYSAYSDISENLRPLTQKISVRTWDGYNIADNEFYRDYIVPQNIKSSVGFTFFDVEGSAKAVFMLDRMTHIPFSERELQLLHLAYPQLNNLHKNFFSHCSNVNKLENVDWKTTSLTAREIDVTILLCQGVSPSNISKKLHITQPTVNKHISHIYSKMQVSNRQELLVRILND